jgi:hypothetical protein
MPNAGTVANLYVRINRAPEEGQWEFTIMNGAAPTAVSCTIAEEQTECADTANSAVFAAGDLISIRSTPTGGPHQIEWVVWSVGFTAE